MTLKLRTTPHPYQLECLEEIEDFKGRALLALSPGLGKTIVSLLYLHKHPEITKAVVVCPASAKYVWENECRKHLGMRVDILEKLKPNISSVKINSRVFVISCSILHAWLPFLKNLNPQLVIADECHVFMDRFTLRTRSFRELCQGVPSILALSGTPLVNRPMELWPCLNILKPKVWSNFYSYGHTFCGARLILGRWDFRGASKLPRLRRDLRRHCMVRRRKEDVLKELPPKSRQVVPLDISNRKEYDRAVKDFLSWLHDISPGRAARAAKNEKMVKLGYLLQLAAEGKLKGVMEWVDNFLRSGQKLIIFGIHKKILSALEDKYKNICVKVDGSIIGRQRQKCFDQFNKVKSTRLLIGNIQASGVAWSCTSASDTAVIELPWSPGILEQALDRTHGLNRGVQGKVSQSWILVAHGTVEEKLCDLLQRKQRHVISTLDGGKVRNDMDIYDQLIMEMDNV